MTKCFTGYLIHVGAFNAKVKIKETWSLEKWRGKIGGGRDGKGDENRRKSTTPGITGPVCLAGQH